MIASILEKIAQERGIIKVGKINVDEHPELAGQFGIMSIPALAVMLNGRVVNRPMGVRPKSRCCEEKYVMGLFNLLRGANINQGVMEYSRTPGAILLDVRMPSEYMNGHIPGSKSVPLPEIIDKGPGVADKDTPLFVYCHSGMRSRQAVETLSRMGYSNAKNIGGISAYTGKVEH